MFMAARCAQLDAQHSLGLKWHVAPAPGSLRPWALRRAPMNHTTACRKEETSVATDEFLREAAARRTVLAACVLTVCPVCGA